MRLLTKGGHDWTDRYPWIVETTRKLKQDQFVLDGEAVVLNVDGMSDFTALQSLFTGTFAGETILIQAPWASNAAWMTTPSHRRRLAGGRLRRQRGTGCLSTRSARMRRKRGR